MLSVLGPAMAISVLRQGGYRYQALEPGRTGERPHAGPLHYERMFATPYATVAAAVRGLRARRPSATRPA